MSRLGRSATTRCEFRTAHGLTLLPLRLARASYRPFDCLPAGLDCRLSHTPKAALTLRLEWDLGAHPDASRLDRLSLHLRGAQGLAERLYMRMTGHVCGGYVRTGDRRDGRCVSLPPRCVVAKGFDDAEALLPVSGGSYRGCRLLREYFACPARFSFVEISDLRLAIASASAPALEPLDIVLLLDTFDESLMTSVDRSNFALHCTPVINLFAKSADRVTVDDRRFEHHVVVDRTRPLDHEVFAVEGIEGYATAHAQPQRFAPFYRARDAGPGERAAGYFQARRTPRSLSASPASNAHYAGSEVFVALVDPAEAPYAANVRQLGIDVLCTNRHLPLSMPVGEGDTDFTAGADLPALERIRCIVGPSAPRPPLAEQAGLWRLLDMLSASRLPLMERADADGDRMAQCDAQALRQWLSTLCPPGDEAGRRQIALLRQASMRTITRRLPLPGPVSFGRGLEITLSFDDAAWAGAHTSVFSAVLARALADYLPINQFAETVARTPTHGVVARYPAQVGRCEIL